MKALYHREVFWRNEFDKALSELIKTDHILVSKHIKNTTNTWCDHDKISINKLIAITYGCKNGINDYYLFEVEITNGVISKAVFRTSYSADKDIIIVVRHNFIVTAWLNNKEDTHVTLDDTKYSKLY